ncbi:MAG: SIMPL domain-containing protein [Acidimicrobiales bacterium]
MSTDERALDDPRGGTAANGEPAPPAVPAARRGRLTDLAAMAAVVLAACAIGVALWGQSPAKAAAKAPVRPSSASLTAALVDPVGCSGSVPKLTVQGDGTATGTPDLLTLVAQINVTELTAQESLADDNAQTAAVDHVLKADGVQTKDIQTTDLSIQPNYTWTDNTARLTGYAVSDTISANFHAPFASAGKAIDDITGAAGNDLQIEGLNFSFEDPRAVEDQARTDAVTQAVSDAESMAEAAGEQLGSVCSVTDDSAVQQYGPEPGAYSDTLGVAATAKTPLEPGTQQETAQVTVVYSLKPVS